MRISILIPAKNEELYLKECLESALWADEIIVLLNDSTDGSFKITGKYKKVTTITDRGGTFASRKNELVKHSSGDWLFFLDADERITPLLKNEILKVLKSPKSGPAFAVPRRNILLGKEMSFGGWSPDYVVRLFRRKTFKKFSGDLHEQPEFTGTLHKLTEPLVHLQPDTLEPAFEKSILWSQIEAKLIFDSHHPPVAWWRVLRMWATTLFDRLIVKQGYQDGVEGFIEAVYQSYHTMIIYLRLWELQARGGSVPDPRPSGSPLIL